MLSQRLDAEGKRAARSPRSDALRARARRTDRARRAQQRQVNAEQAEAYKNGATGAGGAAQGGGRADDCRPRRARACATRGPSSSCRGATPPRSRRVRGSRRRRRSRRRLAEARRAAQLQSRLVGELQHSEAELSAGAASPHSCSRPSPSTPAHSQIRGSRRYSPALGEAAGRGNCGKRRAVGRARRGAGALVCY